jgi:hypothetical protein
MKILTKLIVGITLTTVSPILSSAPPSGGQAPGTAPPAQVWSITDRR